MMNLALLGSTGSIGTSTLDVVRRFPERFRLRGLAAGNNAALLARQAREFQPETISIADAAAAAQLRQQLAPAGVPEVLAGPEGARAVATAPGVDMVVAAIAGGAGLLPTLAAAETGKDIALANKESLVMAGALLTRAAAASGSRIVPVDSEHSAVFQVLEGRAAEDVRAIILTASGGPFLHASAADLRAVTPAAALKHPRWQMGVKVTTDSATLMNKGLEVIEAHWLFGVAPDRIKVVVHPQSIIHSMVEFVDGTVLAQLSQPDMKGPIAYALSMPGRLDAVMEPLDLPALGTLTFMEPDRERFPALGLAYRALHQGGLMPAVMNAANEVAVALFHRGAITFVEIPAVIERVMDRYTATPEVSLETVLDADRWARAAARQMAGLN